MVRARLLFRRPEAQLLRPPRGLQPAAAQREEPAGARRDHAERPQVLEPAERRARALGDQPRAATGPMPGTRRSVS